MISAPTLLLWAHSVLVWVVAHYTISGAAETASVESGNRRSWHQFIGPALRLVLSALAVGAVSESVWLTVLTAALGTALLATRMRRPHWRVWEREVVATGAFSWAVLILIEQRNLELRHPVVAMATSAEHIAVACLVSALFIFTLGGGTYIVRGILTASGVPQAVGAANQERLKHGRWIGALERAVLFVVLIAGSYEALGFIVAAKGLIRSRQFENQRELTEYFLIGSLASVAVALATGTAARYVIQKFW